MLGNRTLGAMTLLAVCGGITMTVNLVVMDARAGHLGEISSTNDPPGSTPPVSIAGPTDPGAKPSTVVLGAVITAPVITTAPIVPVLSDTVLSDTVLGDD